MNNPLAQLEPLMAPPAPSWWPPAPGWWLLSVLLLAIALGAWRWYHRPSHTPFSAESATANQARTAALQELALLPEVPAAQAAGPWLSQLNSLLKRLCLVLYPQERPQRLFGQPWLAFLDRHCPAAGLGRWPQLAEGGYQRDCQLSADSAQQLHQAVRLWIDQHV